MNLDADMIYGKASHYTLGDWCKRYMPKILYEYQVDIYLGKGMSEVVTLKYKDYLDYEIDEVIKTGNNLEIYLRDFKNEQIAG